MNVWATILSVMLTLTAARSDADAPSASLYDLAIELIDQSAGAKPFDVYRGEVVLVTMFYGSCPMACPLLIDSVRAVESALTPAERQRVRVLMVSIDPDRDTPQALAALAKQRRIDLARWTVARASHEDVRMLAAALDIQYRRLPNGEYNHTSVISVLTPEGRLVKQTSILGRADPELVSAIRGVLH